MEKTILIRYGEIFLKGNNRGFFENTLIKNIKKALREYKFDFIKTSGRYLIDNYNLDDEDKIISILTKVLGIHSISVAYKTDTNFDNIAKLVVELGKDLEGTFRITVKRANKKLPFTSTELAAKLGGALLDANPNLTVDLFDFDKEIFVDVRENGETFVFMDKIMGAGGMPVGTAANAISLLSGGIDSPVATYMMAKRGAKIFAIHFHSYPYTSELAKEKVIDLAKKIKPYTGSTTLFVIPFTHIQQEIHENCPSEYMITIMRRFMMRIAERLAKENECKAIITGESLGQVASQTMESINVTNEGITLPIFRPLIGMDKTEIIEIAKKIDTFDLSILPYEDCCTVFLPKNPVIKPKIDLIKKAESVLDFDKLIEDAIENKETIII